ncbi:hypothetical protein SFRURICE_017027 [Spodoptera frugiperda]|nr:hypothetical protein SFRURICE_017027 [Spodoptera frugiperda]
MKNPRGPISLINLLAGQSLTLGADSLGRRQPVWILAGQAAAEGGGNRRDAPQLQPMETCVWVSALMMSSKKPPKLSNLNTFYEKFESILKTLCSRKDKKIIVCGDFNIDTLKKNNISLDFECCLLSFNLKLVITQPTRLSSATCLDNFAHNTNQKCDHEVFDFALSDHTAQLIKITVNKTCQLKSWRIKRRDMCEENLKKFNNYLQSLSFSDVYDTDDPNLAYNNFLNIFQVLYNSCFPYKSILVKPHKQIKWISRGIRICSKRQRQLLWQKRLKPTDENKIKFETYAQI